MHTTPRRTEIILNALFERYYAEECQTYGEPGYQDPAQAILFANWNEVPKWMCDYLEEAGFELEWSDEWIIDHDNGKAYRTRPDCWSWQPSYHITDNGDILTPDDYVSSWVEEFEVWDWNHPLNALPNWILESDICKEGFEPWPDAETEFENGWHPGQTDEPQDILEKILKQHPGAKVVFRLSEQSQFYCKFQAFFKVEEDDDQD